MITATHKLFINLALLTVFTASCVSVGVQQPQSLKSSVVQFKEPGNQFEESESKYLDRSWLHKTSGATISFLSDCDNPTDPSLENIFQGTINELDNVKIIEQEKVTYNSREALRSTFDGHVDGVATRISLVIFKKHNCTYIITYASKESEFDKNKSTYQLFLKGFYVP